MFMINFNEGVARLWKKGKKKGWFLKEYKIYIDKNGAFVVKNLIKVYFDKRNCVIF